MKHPPTTQKPVKDFFLRGLMFGGFGPVILGIIYLILHVALDGLTLSAPEVCLGILSTYLLAFVHAGASVFNQIESWPLAKSLLFHFSSLYIAYALCYVTNSWIPFEPAVLGIFTAVFVGIYFVVWGIVFLCVSASVKKMNQTLHGGVGQ